MPLSIMWVIRGAYVFLNDINGLDTRTACNMARSDVSNLDVVGVRT